MFHVLHCIHSNGLGCVQRLKDQLVRENADSWVDAVGATLARWASLDWLTTGSPIERLQVPFIPDMQVIEYRNVGQVLIHSTRIVLGRPEEVQKWQDLAVFQSIQSILLVLLGEPWMRLCM